MSKISLIFLHYAYDYQTLDQGKVKETSNEQQLDKTVSLYCTITSHFNCTTGVSQWECR